MLQEMQLHSLRTDVAWCHFADITGLVGDVRRLRKEPTRAGRFRKAANDPEADVTLRQ
jgi:hypothetical protein